MCIENIFYKNKIIWYLYECKVRYCKFKIKNSWFWNLVFWHLGLRHSGFRDLRFWHSGFRSGTISYISNYGLSFSSAIFCKSQKQRFCESWNLWKLSFINLKNLKNLHIFSSKFSHFHQNFLYVRWVFLKKKFSTNTKIKLTLEN